MLSASVVNSLVLQLYWQEHFWLRTFPRPLSPWHALLMPSKSEVPFHLHQPALSVHFTSIIHVTVVWVH
jgi:hypothetical protein